MWCGGLLPVFLRINHETSPHKDCHTYNNASVWKAATTKKAEDTPFLYNPLWGHHKIMIILSKAGAELGQAQLKLGLGLTLI